VLPLDDRRYERAADPGRPMAAMVSDSYTYYPGTSVLHLMAAPNLSGRNHAITAHVDMPAKGAEGVLASLGGEFGGFSLFVQGGRLYYVHNYLKMQQFELASNRPVPPGPHQLTVRFEATGKHQKPDYSTGNVQLLIDGAVAGEMKDVRYAGQYSVMTGYGLSIGRNIGTPVSHRYRVPFAFTGNLRKVTVDLK
jgi:arylsulfatase